MINLSSAKNKIVVAAFALTVVAAGAIGVQQVSAASDSSGVNSLVQMIAQKFNLKESEVQAVFDQNRQNRQVKMEKNYETQLDQYVTDGKITQDQKAKILAKHKELLAARQSNKQNMINMTPQERQAARQKEKQALDDWAKQNGIDLQYLMPFGKGHRGFGKMRMQVNSPNVTPTGSVQ